MLYSLYEMQQAALAPMRAMADMTQQLYSNPYFPLSYTRFGKAVAAGAEVLHGIIQSRSKPAWDIDEIVAGGEAIPVDQEVVIDDAFCQLRRFRRADASGDLPRILLVAPMSGHFATLLRGTVQRLVEEHEVYVTDWRDAALVPAEAGAFGIETYVGYVMRQIRHLGPEVHVMAVCQPAPLVLAAVALLAQAEDPAQPRSMILMGGPVDTRAAPTIVTRFAENRPLDWFEKNLIATVPFHYPGGGRDVYPGFLQLTAFLMMNPGRHFGAHVDQFNHLIVGDGDSADAHRRFYDEYLSVADVSGTFYLETVDRIFKQHALPRGRFTWMGARVEPWAIGRTALMTIEGELDDISAPGQTIAAHDLCTGIPADRHLNHVQKGVGHYGIFNGRRWREVIAPRIAAFVRDPTDRRTVKAA
ncbi:MAG: polyhydroxyalkanoate depolymerase [Azospirillaceae bacterium]